MFLYRFGHELARFLCRFVINGEELPSEVTDQVRYILVHHWIVEHMHRILEIIDVFENHDAAMAENILLAPTLVIETPRREVIIGNLENEDQILTALGIRG